MAKSSRVMSATGVFSNGIMRLAVIESAIVSIKSLPLPHSPQPPMIFGVGRASFIGMDSGGHVGVSQGHYLQPLDVVKLAVKDES